MTSAPSHSTHITWHHATVTRARREALNGHQGAVVWFTGPARVRSSFVAIASNPSLIEASAARRRPKIYRSNYPGALKSRAGKGQV